MRNIMMVIGMFVGTLLLGCGGLKVVIVKPLDQNDESLAKAVILAVANQPSTETDALPVVKCLCGGTGRSGDGLGPCACPDGCSCKVKREEPIVVEEPPAVEEPPVEELAVEEVEASTESESQGTNDLTETVERIVSVTETLAESQVKIAARFDEFDARLKAIESPVVKQVELSTTEAAKSDLPAQQLVVFGSFDGSSQECTNFDSIDVPNLVNAGWTVGKDDSYQIVLVNVRDEAPEKWKNGHKLAIENGIPYFAFYDDGKFVKGYAGRTSSSAIADEMNRLITTTHAVNSSQSEPWKSIAETWPARVPINGTTTPSKSVLIWHLRGGGRGGENHVNELFTKWPLEDMTAGQLVTLHDSDHPISTVNSQPVKQVAVRSKRGQVSSFMFFGSQRCLNGKCR